jgi:hypothetical protein
VALSARNRETLVLAAQGWSTLMAVSYEADELAAQNADDLPHAGAKILKAKLLFRERAAVGGQRSWFDVSAFQDMVISDEVESVLLVTDYLESIDLGLASALEETGEIRERADLVLRVEHIHRAIDALSA